MKNKKKMAVIVEIVVLCMCVIICIFTTNRNGGYKSIDGLFKGLTKAINNTDNQAIIKCFPDFMQKSLPTLSNEAIKEFHNKVGDIHFDIIHQSNIKSKKDTEDEINSKYNCNIKLERYSLITCKYHDDFSETTFEVIKIDGRWYLYHGGRIPDPIAYFIN